MRQRHEPGEKVFVDYSGKKIGIVDPRTGEIREAGIFAGVLGASNLTFSEAAWSQQLPDWIGSHVRMFRFSGGVPKLVVPGNLKSGVHKASFYDPAHMPKDHRGYASWTTDRFRAWAAATGPNTEALILAIIASRGHPQQGFRTCPGVLRHVRGLPKERVGAAAARAVAIGALSCKAIVGLIDARRPHPPASEEAPLLIHENLRNPDCFQ